MVTRSIVIVGLPESGKTTFLAALWHVITAREVPTRLAFHNLRVGSVSHLNDIAARWRDAKEQDRTAIGGNRFVSMNLLDADGEPIEITFPDVAGEAYRQMWEERDYTPEIEEYLKALGVLLFIHADTIRAPSWIVDEVALCKALGLPFEEGQVISWHPRLSPTQVPLVDFLQLLRRPPFDIGPRRLALMLSAWDKARDDGLTPEVYLKTKLPLLNQYLTLGLDEWTWRVYGLSAQGGDYDSTDVRVAKKDDAANLRNLDRPSERIQVVGYGGAIHDLTEPLAWLTE